MPRGRPLKSAVRQHLSELLFVMGKLTAYTAYKHYIKLFAKTSQRNVYYQLTKGSDMELFVREEVEEKGDYSWGTSVRKVYYSLKSLDTVTAVDKRIVDYFEEEKRKYNEIAQGISTKK